MSPNLWPRPTLLVIVGAVVLSSAACGGAADKPTESSPGPALTTAIRHAGGQDRAGGLISSVSGHTVQVTNPVGSADIDFNTMTKLTEVQSAELSDVVVGSCVSVLATADTDASDQVTAQRVLISAAEDNKCAVETPPGSAPPPGIPQGPPPGAAEGPPPFGGPSVQGAVASVNGSTIVVANTDPSGASEIQTNVTATADTAYDKRQPTEATAIITGKCADAHGTKDASGALQATKIDLGPATDGRCGPPPR
ncbi:DUF5666 domain-containing protein [Mycobacteroides salmoniphilum]|uniref:DUF5666 domain-containing protein n=1 Tax=Mycobacteroides salmoniphilum TaxID=404941 RepID=UPI000BFF781A|nr:DUF5666 domain-containing protein [Mycobacteroides salmoniphilum]